MANWNNFIFCSMDFLKFSLDFIVYVCHRYNSILLHNFILTHLHLLNLFDYLEFFNYFFFHCWNFNYLLLNTDAVNNFVHKLLYNFVSSDEYWLFNCNLDEFWNLHSFLNDIFNLVDLRDLIIHLNYFIMINSYLYNFFFIDCC